jgi:hypothetical protein
MKEVKAKRLLQVWEISCSSATLSRYLEKHGWKCLVVTRESFDKHNCGKEFWNYRLVPGRARHYYLEIVKAILTFRPTLILVRQNFEVLPLIRLFAPTTPIIMQFHGLEVRGRSTLPWQSLLATKRICSTKDIAQYGTYYGTPIHPMFKKAPPGVRKKGTALFVRGYLGEADALDKAIQYAKDHGLELDIIDRTKGEQIPHEEMPDLLQKYEWYLDFKNMTTRDVISKTAIEFLQTTSDESVGKVVTDAGDILTEFKTTQLSDYLELVNRLNV